MNTNAVTAMNLTNAPTLLGASVEIGTLTLSATIATSARGRVGRWVTRNAAGLRLHEQEITGAHDEIAAIFSARMASYGVTF